jgi:flavin reductase (DIM6/NTAB) family NADH-FMN oxidoreductase RutF
MAEKTQLKPGIIHFYSWPLVLATCADAAGKPNIIALAASSSCSYAPPTIGIAVAHARYSHQLIADSGVFGVNFPSCRHLAEADLTGSIAGASAVRASDWRNDVLATGERSHSAHLSIREPIPLALVAIPRVVEECKKHRKVQLR